jgi:type VI secretion system secreted protein VgrG
MSEYLQTDRPLTVSTPLGQDAFLITEFRGQEAISQLFSFHLDLLAERGSDIQFDKILGESVTVQMRQGDGGKRYFNGLVRRFSQGFRDETFITLSAEVVPRLWLLKKKIQSRIFQQLPIPEILRKVLTGLDVSYELSGIYYPRDYCVQYRESDFDFASRLMEEEGIHYFFKHSDGNHQLILSDSSNPNIPGPSNVIYEVIQGEVREDMRITAWEKSQELRSQEYTLWDHCFELPGNHLEAKRKTVDTVTVGKVTHKLQLRGNDKLEIYDYPGGFAQRFDGIDPGGAPRPQELKKIFEDRDRTVRLRMEQEDAASLLIRGTSDCGNFSAGQKFTLKRHFDANGPYLLTFVEHNARQAGIRSGERLDFDYSNTFACVPAGLKYRPQRVTAKPVIAGVQTATVVGPQGEELFCDKYGRVKVQFHWDREGKKDARSSCWVRVAQVWAGKGWGAFFWPRIGHEVVVTFEEGDPDQPLIIGSVYNAENMPWYMLPMNKELAGFKSASTRGTAKSNYNGIVFNDEKGKEHLSIHSEHNLSLNSEDDKMIHSGRHKGERVGVANVLTIGKFIPSGGGSGGGFDEGNPMPDPPPSGVAGLNAVVTYGDNVQAAFPLNHQLAIGNNVQMCINPFGLAAGVPGATIPAIMHVLAGSGLGGSMQFTLGTSAQFTLGQSYEISIGPPKIEIHAPYGGHVGIGLLCGLLGAFSIVFMILYDVKKGKNEVDHYNYSNAPSDSSGDAARAAALKDEQSGDKERVNVVLAYQLLMEVLLGVIMTLEQAKDSVDWLADDTMKKLYEIDQACLTQLGVPAVGADPDDAPWSDGAGVEWLGGVGILAALTAEMMLVTNE